MSLRICVRTFVVCVLLISGAHLARASGPRWVTGAPNFYPWGLPIVWYTDSPRYFTDPGDLSQYVNHASADAIVDAAASVWNVPTSRLTIAKGGLLDEDVNSSNVYPGSSGVIFPGDVQATNYAAKQIAVIYDSDGAVTDLLLGSGASNPSSCRQNGVTESVDSFLGDGHILHAILILNGRCTGPAPEQQLQLQYQLMRAFGRIIGLAWSQTNDNVFTGNPSPTYQQALHWPVMHPIDVICGPYTYQCMPSPFTLRDDDVAGLDLLYPITYAPADGKTQTFARASRVDGTITFPSGQGMQGVNVVVRRNEPFWPYPEDWESASSVSGYLFRRKNGNPVTGAVKGAAPSGMGSLYPQQEGYFNIFRIPLYEWEGWQNLVITTQPVNPLYTGVFAVGPYDANSVSPSGSVNVQNAWVQGPYALLTYTAPIVDAASGCDVSADGTESAPTQIPASGWWTGNLCLYGHAAWSSLTVKPNRSFTFEVTAQDEQGLATTSKMLPVTGVWNISDVAGSLPSLATAPAAFNSAVDGMTALAAQIGAGVSQTLRMVIADQRGDGRPDYAYQARLFYADSVSPATVPASGGAVTITGMGFRPGNAVTVNGVTAVVTGWTANSITLVAPSLHALNAVTADVTVRDLVTGATTTMSGALSYAAPQPTLVLLSAPTARVFTGLAAATPFAVQAIGSDGITPISDLTVNLTTASGQVRFDTCSASSCSLVTDAQGRIMSTITPLASGAIEIVATSSIGNVTAEFVAVDRIRSIAALTPMLYVAEQRRVAWNAEVVLGDNSAPTAGISVQWNPGATGIIFNQLASVADAQSIAQSSALVGPLAAGATATASACAWTTVCTPFTAQGVGADQWMLEPVSGGGQVVSLGTLLGPVVLRVVDRQGHPVAGAPVEVHQALEPWIPSCSGEGRCPVSPVYAAEEGTLISASDGTVTVAPLDLAGEPVICRIAAATGTGGFLALVLERQP